MMRSAAVLLALVLGVVSVVAATPDCDVLDGDDRALAERILAGEYLYNCCDDTIAACLEQRPTCALAARLADNVCRRVVAGQDEAGIRRALSRRARSMVGGGTPAEIDLTSAPVVGADGAPVTIVVYACARCPYCSRLVPELYRAITDGPLAGDARLAFRVFPIRGHEGSTEAGLGFEAAAKLGAFWPFMLTAYRHFDEYSPERQVEWAAAVGLDRTAFEALVADPATRDALVVSKKEGLVNRVEETPTLFINGRRWVGDLSADELLDAVEEEAARVRGEQWLAD